MLECKMMDKDKVIKNVEDTLACTAFAEAGEPCPISSDKQAAGTTTTETTETKEKGKKHKKSVFGAIGEDFACTAFHDQNEECPISGEEK